MAEVGVWSVSVCRMDCEVTATGSSDRIWTTCDTRQILESSGKVNGCVSA